MKFKIVICLLAILLGVAQASTHRKHHSEGHKQELLQTQSKTEAESALTATTSTETATDTGSEAECDPECLYKFPYLDSKCTTRPEHPSPQPVPTVEDGETFILDAEGCYAFEVTVEEEPKPEPKPKPEPEPTETFVVDAEGCYDFPEELEPIIRIEECFDEEEPIPPKPEPKPESDESCDEPSHVYIYPFIHPGGDCKVEEETESITVVNKDVPIGGEIIVTVDEDGESHTTYVDENGETFTPGPHTEEVEEFSDEGGYGTPTTEEHGETSTPGPHTEEVEEFSDEGGYGIPTTEEHGETFTPGPHTEEVEEFSDEGEWTYTSQEGNTLGTNPIEETSDEHPEVTIEIPFGETDYEERFELTAEACYIFGEEESGEITVRVEESDHEEPIPHDEECTDASDLESECIIGDTYSFGTTIIYEQPCTYIDYHKWDEDRGHHVTYTYVLTNVYSGIFKTSECHYVIYGAGAVNFYNNYYGIDARQHDAPSCSCTCGYQTYTFTYTFGF